MKSYVVISIFILVSAAACKEKKEPAETDDKPISAISIIKGQLAHLDTSLYQVTKFELIDNGPDTTYLKREEIKQYAAPFLTLPEIADKDYYSKYAEDRIIDAELETLSITSTLKDAFDAEIQKQIVIIDIKDISDGKIKSIYIDRYINTADSSLQQKLFWEVDKYFSIGSIIEKENQPDKTQTIKIAWQ